MRWVSLLVMVLFSACSSGSKTAATGPTAVPTLTMAQEKDAVLNYTACEGGMTLNAATTAVLRGVRVQEIGSIRYVTHDEKRSKYAVEYKAANGADKRITFNYTPATGKVDAEDNDALAILRMMGSGCK